MIENILERLEEEREIAYADFYEYLMEYELDNDFDEDDDWFYKGLIRAKKIVQEVAKEYGKDTNVRSNGWIPCGERLPEEQDEYLVYWTAEGFKGKCFYEIIEYHLEDGWIGEIPQAPFGKYTVIAWMELPAYQKGE